MSCKLKNIVVLSCKLKNIVVLSCKLKNIVVFLLALSDFIVLRNFGKIIYDFSRKCDGTVDLSEFHKLEKLSIKIGKAELDISLFKQLSEAQCVSKIYLFPASQCWQI